MEDFSSEDFDERDYSPTLAINLSMNDSDPTKVTVADFTGEPTSEGDKSPTSILYDPSRDRESVRGTIALTLVITLVVMIGTILVMAWDIGENVSAFKDIFTMLITPLIAVVGTVTGFYFGQQSSK